MEYHFSAVAKRQYVHAIGSGTHSDDNMRRFFMDTEQVRLQAQLDAVLLEARFIGRNLSFGVLYSICIDNRAGAALVKRLAYVDTNADHLPEGGQFAELAASKLGVNFRVFRTVAEAERWLNE